MNAPSDIIIRRAPLAATSWNPDERTFEVVFSTGVGVERQDERGHFLERLSLAQDWSAFIGAPVLNSHRRGILTDVLGSVLTAWTVGGNREARAIIGMSRRDDVEPIIQDILDGHLRGVSVGYAVHDWAETTEGGRRVKTATRWTPVELSIVPIPADRQAIIRGNETMTASAQPESAPVTTLPAAAVPTPTASADRAAVNAEIRSIGAVAGLDQGWIDGQIDAGARADAARAAAFQAMQTRTAPLQTIRTVAPMVTVDHTDPASIRSAMGDALAHRLAPGRVKLEGRARDFSGYRMLDMIGGLAEARGERINLRDQNALMERAVGAHSTSDFPLLLADAANKSLLANYAAAEPTYRRWAGRRSFTDFRDHSFLRIGDFPQFQETAENGELKYGTISENREKVRAKELNAGIAIGRRALINDDLSALADFSSMIAIRAAADENARVYALLAANAALSDGIALFHASHGNKAAAGAAITVSSLSLAVAALRKQKSLDSVPLNLAPRFLVVGPEKELEGRQVLAAVTATKAGDVNPWAGTMELVVDANIAGNGWYVVADPAAAPSVVYGYVSGAEGPQIRTEIDFDTRAVKVAAGLDFGCGVIDFRGLYQNEGV
ncbi:prohead protease/major capsid protein fusion protein [Ancylobacter oerskovii]|uniref:Prohead protease/major capsid protein fusion protein n=1 Tax=Ancylobacter oerskovii TaxID=459519 RepID=A0ABW4YUU8_9HYPH|nr:prohead protease/major capsid protein fusion protein [Ancylobacter oerskovii]MBS7544368.1 Mu-like prophage major head subunit gpT family protein [Ancylobacter oerskovii]